MNSMKQFIKWFLSDKVDGIIIVFAFGGMAIVTLVFLVLCAIELVTLNN